MPWTTASSRPPSANGTRRIPRGRSCWRRCASARAWRSASRTTGAASIGRALIAAVGHERYALPLTYVAETVEFGTTPLTTMEGKDAIVLRDRVVPLVDLRKLLGTNGGAPAPPPRRPVIVLEMGERRAGIVVDGMLSQQEIVVKGFDAPQGTLPVFSGATIMGDGVPALILDSAGLV